MISLSSLPELQLAVLYLAFSWLLVELLKNKTFDKCETHLSRNRFHGTSKIIQ
ncbi:hypothetical protein GCM10007140_31520 [Priestia taiwanensis]|uniref:Uncharacterized protein n=1 Tax=Priestia taiwanensis TaxID=1347902 RepID=A0A917AXH1_9BACI|nr:hypothetical protein GCM10007140_31520 [Priestia taiwanensis]